MEIKELVGKTLIGITGVKRDSDEIVFTVSDTEKYRLYHSQECCEQVQLQDFEGDPDDLIGTPILQAEEVSSDNSKTPDPIATEWPRTINGYEYTHTWTFYRFATIKGSLVLRWYGDSNGYYSERVDFERIGG